MPTEKLSLHRKLAQIMHEAERIPKRGKAPAAMGGFEFVQVGDAADYIRKALAEHVISMLPTNVTIVGQTEHATKSGGSMTTVDLLMEWTLTDGESGESIVIHSFGAGADGGDKYSGKAQTNAMKYALLMGFLLSTGDDPELSNSEDRRARKPRGSAETEVLTAGSSEQQTDEASREPTHADGLIGTVEVRQEWLGDFEMRQSPEGMLLGFRLKEGRTAWKVVAKSPLAETLAAFKDEAIGQTVTCWGTLVGEEFTPKGTKRAIGYQVLHLERIKGPFGEFPAPVQPPIAPGQEALPLTDEEKALVAGGMP